MLESKRRRFSAVTHSSEFPNKNGPIFINHPDTCISRESLSFAI